MKINKINLAICSTGELYGGVEQFIYTFSNYLKKETSVNLIVILFNRGLLYEKLRETNIETYIIDSNFKYNKYNLYLIKSVIELFKKKNINIVHTHGYKANILCSIAAKICNARVIKTEHGKQEPSKGLGFFKMSLNLYLDRLFTKYFADGIVYVSRDIQNFFNKKYSKSKQWVIYNGIAPIEVVEKKDTGIDSRYFNIGIIGRISEVKGHIYLLKAMKELEHLDKIRLYIFGEGPSERVCKDFCSSNGLSNKVFFMGFEKDIHVYMKKLNLLVMPSLHEGLPYTVLEAMSFKVPVIASEVGGLKEVIVNNHNGLLVPPQDTELLAQSIEKAYKDLKLRESLAHNAFIDVFKNYSINIMVKKYIIMYKNLI